MLFDDLINVFQNAHITKLNNNNKNTKINDFFGSREKMLEKTIPGNYESNS